MYHENSNLIFLKGERVALRTLIEDDASTLLEIVHSDLARFNTLQLTPKTIDDEIAFIRSSRSGGKFPTNLVFGIHYLKEDRLIGTMGVGKIDWVSRTATTGSLIGYEELVGVGLGSEAKMMLLDYAFNTLNLRLIDSEAWAFNGRSNGSLKKCGYQELFRLKGKVFKAGEYHDAVVYECTRESFEEARKNYVTK